MAGDDALANDEPESAIATTTNGGGQTTNTNANINDDEDLLMASMNHEWTTPTTFGVSIQSSDDGILNVVESSDHTEGSIEVDDSPSIRQPGRSSSQSAHPNNATTTSVSTSTLQSSPQITTTEREYSTERNNTTERNDPNNDIFTRYPPPGANHFCTWIAKKPSAYHAQGLGSQVFHADQAVRTFLGPHDPQLVQKIRQRRRHLPHHMGGAGYATVSYKLNDTPVWHEKALELHDEYAELAEQRKGWRHFFTWFSCQFLPHNDEDDSFHWYHLKSAYVTRGMLVLIGVVVSCLGWGVAESSDQILEAKLKYIEERDTPWGFGYFLMLNLAYVLLSFLPVAMRPVSGGSGIAEAKAVLNGIVIPCCTHLVTAAAKGFSVIFSGAASLPVGLEGPLIFIGLSIGDNAQRLLKDRNFPTLRSDDMRRDFATVGTAAGVTAAFLSPVGGVLFAMEEGASFWSVLTCWRAFAADVVAAIVGFILTASVKDHSNLWNGFNVKNLAKFNGLDGQQTDPFISFHLYDYFTFAMFGIVGGFLGACFNEANRHLSVFRKRLDLSKFCKGAEVLILTAIMSVLSFFLPLLYKKCSSLEITSAEDKYFRQFGCEDGEYNQLASLLLNPPGSTGINLLFHEPEDVFTLESCLIAGFVYLIMLLLLFGTSIGMGIFIPLLYVGACFGRAFGVALSFQTQTYAIVGSVAMLAGVARVLISLTVIMMETTGLTYFVTPFMVATIFARVTGKSIFGREGIYDIILQLRGIPFLEEESPRCIEARGLRAEHIMSPPPLVLLEPTIQVGNLVQALKTHKWEDFPVTDPERNGALVGSIMRIDLLTILQYPALFYDANPSDEEEGSVEKKPQNVKPRALKYELVMQAHFATDVPTIDEIARHLSSEDMTKLLDLTPYIQIAHNTFDRHGSAERAFQVFRTLGLRHLTITGHHGEPVGIISRTDLAILGEIEDDDELYARNRKSVGRYINLT